MNVRCDADISVTIKSGNKVLDKSITKPGLLNAHLTVFSAMHGGVSGYTNWHDNEGNLISKPRVTIKLVNPQDMLSKGQYCPCERHVNA